MSDSQQIIEDGLRRDQIRFLMKFGNRGIRNMAGGFRFAGAYLQKWTSIVSTSCWIGSAAFGNI